MLGQMHEAGKTEAPLHGMTTRVSGLPPRPLTSTLARTQAGLPLGFPANPNSPTLLEAVPLPMLRWAPFSNWQPWSIGKWGEGWEWANP